MVLLFWYYQNSTTKHGVNKFWYHQIWSFQIWYYQIGYFFKKQNETIFYHKNMRIDWYYHFLATKNGTTKDETIFIDMKLQKNENATFLVLPNLI